MSTSLLILHGILKIACCQRSCDRKGTIDTSINISRFLIGFKNSISGSYIQSEDASSLTPATLAFQTKSLCRINALYICVLIYKYINNLGVYNCNLTFNSNVHAYNVRDKLHQH